MTTKIDFKETMEGLPWTFYEREEEPRTQKSTWKLMSRSAETTHGLRRFDRHQDVLRPPQMTLPTASGPWKNSAALATISGSNRAIPGKVPAHSALVGKNLN